MSSNDKLSLCRRKETLLVNSVQPLINKALELSTVADNQIKVLKEYDAFAQEKANEASAATLQEIVEKEQAAKDIMRSLNKQFTIFTNKILPPKKQQSAPGWDTSESQGPVGVCTLMVLRFGNSAVFVETCKRSCEPKQSQGFRGWVEAPLSVNNPWFMVFRCPWFKPMEI